MSPVYIKTRTVKSGKRYLVYWRRGGRAFREEYAGSFKTLKEAKTRRDLIAGELAAARDPVILLDKLKKPPAAARDLAAWFDDFTSSRIDLGDKAIKQTKIAKTHWTRILGADRDPATITASDVIAGIAELTKTPLAPKTVEQYVSQLRQLLDYADVEPNPARSRKVRLPRSIAAEVSPPTTKEWKALLEHARKRSLLALRLIECCGLRVSEATGLTWGDIDFVEGKIRVSRVGTKTAAGRRWLPVPEELLDLVDGLRAPEDRQPQMRVFGLDHSQVRYDLARACLDAGVAAHSPHDLRHRRVSLWLRLGIDPVQTAKWAGHARSSMSLDVYGHVVLDPREDEWRGFWAAVYDAGLSAGAARVRHEETE